MDPDHEISLIESFHDCDVQVCEDVDCNAEPCADPECAVEVCINLEECTHEPCEAHPSESSVDSTQEQILHEHHEAPNSQTSILEYFFNHTGGLAYQYLQNMGDAPFGNHVQLRGTQNFNQAYGFPNHQGSTMQYETNYNVPVAQAQQGPEFAYNTNQLNPRFHMVHTAQDPYFVNDNSAPVQHNMPDLHHYPAPDQVVPSWPYVVAPQLPHHLSPAFLFRFPEENNFAGSDPMVGHGPLANSSGSSVETTEQSSHSGSSQSSPSQTPFTSVGSGQSLDDSRKSASPQSKKRKSISPTTPEPSICHWVISEGLVAPHRICGRLFETPQDLHQHVKHGHIESMRQPPFHCSWEGCKKFRAHCYQNRTKLDRHVRVHAQYFEHICNTCGKEFTTQDQFNNHKNACGGMKPFPCSYDGCEKSSSTRTQAETHMRTHTGEKPYKCPYCPYKSGDSSNMSKHLRNKHGENGGPRRPRKKPKSDDSGSGPDHPGFAQPS